MAERDFAKTGIKGLDVILGGGIPRGNLTLVEGAIGTGKTTLGAEFVFRGATEFHEPGLIVLFEVSPDKFIRDVARFGWDLPELERQGRLKMVFTTRSVFQQELQQADSLLLDEAGKIGARRIFIDSFGQLALGNDGSRDPRDDFHILAEGLHRENLTAMLVLEVVAQDGVRLAAPAPEEFMADTVMRLRLEPLERAVQRSIEIVRMEGRIQHQAGLIDGVRGRLLQSGSVQLLAQLPGNGQANGGGDRQAGQGEAGEQRHVREQATDRHESPSAGGEPD